MQLMRDVIRGSLARSLRLLPVEDRLAAALPVVCGSVLASHCSVDQLNEEGILHLRVDAPDWLPPLIGLRDLLHSDLQRVAGVPIAGVHFVQAGSAPDRSPGLLPSGEDVQEAPRRQRPARRSDLQATLTRRPV